MSKFFMFFLLLGLVSCEAQRTQTWQDDIDFWVSEVKKQHYVYKTSPLPAAFTLELEKLKNNLPVYSDQQIVVEMLGLSSLLGDGHTYVLPWGGKPEAFALPLRFYLFTDGLFVISAKPEYSKWIGKKVLSIGGLSSQEVMTRMARYISRDNEQGINWIGPFLLSFEGMLQAIGVAGTKSYSITFQEDGKPVTAQITVTPFEPTRGIPKLVPQPVGASPLYLQQVNQTYWIKTIQPGTLYVQFNQVMNDPRESLQQFSGRLTDSLRSTNPKKLIVDVRHNNGGNADLLGPLLETLQQFKNKPGNTIYILTGRNTFSAAQIFISKTDRMVKPIFVGEVSSSKPNFVGEENMVLLPNSQVICSISNRYHESIPGDTRTAIEPHIKIELTSDDYFKGRDPVLEAVLAH